MTIEHPLFSGTLEEFHFHNLKLLLKNHRLLQNISETRKKYILKYLKKAILNTDLARHKELVHKFKEFLPGTKKGLLLSYVLHGAELSNQCLEFSVSKFWTEKLLRECCSGIKESELYEEEGSFDELVCLPFWKTFVDKFEELVPCRDTLVKNINLIKS